MKSFKMYIGNEEGTKNSHNNIVLKVLLALLPTLIFWQNYAWMTLNSYLGIAFLIIWALMIWSVYQFTEKNHIIERLFRLTEISFFLLPLSAIIFSFVLGSKAISSTTNGFEQAGVALGTAIGGTFIVILSFIIGLAGGVIMHLITNKYEKKAEASGIKQTETLSNKHGVILSLVAIIILAIIMGSVSGAQHSVNVAKEKEALKNSLQQGGTSQTNTPSQDQNKVQPKKVSIEITNKGFHEADFMSGDYQDQITMDLKFTNETDKEIRGVEGVLTFYDIFDNKISATKVSYDKGIPANSSKVWKSGTDYNQFMNEDVKLKNTELKGLKYKWEVLTIIYADGSKETF
ncbi:hypothetical protein L6250_00955 [Candidatus Parcubacteria bacterium]|nr:hypothetical protein [Patescibacteria group bacterium]MCG2688193.1 hypothetical protein [Candidatus Parcubacteria bacterium]MCG2697644.1 hypothetical protein [Candidatus Parcubacteria bacterium]